MSFFAGTGRNKFTRNLLSKNKLVFESEEALPEGPQMGRIAFVSDGDSVTLYNYDGTEWVPAPLEGGGEFQILTQELDGMDSDSTYNVTINGGVTEGATVVSRLVFRNGTYQEPSSGKYTLVGGVLTIVSPVPVADGERFVVVLYVNA